MAHFLRKPGSHSSRRRLNLATLVLIIGILILAISCGTDDGSQQQGVSEEGQGNSTGDGYASINVENCGIEQSFEQPPQRVITMNQHATEMMLALGLQERMVGTAFMDNEIHPNLAEEYEQVPVLSEQYPSQEAVLGEEPDFVFAGFSSAFENEAAGSREELHELGISTYLSTEYCNEDEAVSFGQVYEDIRNIGEIFGVQGRADELVGQMQNTLQETARAVEDVEEPVTVANLGTSGNSASAAGANTVANEVIEAAGAENAFADLDQRRTEVSWEEVVARDPDVILVDYCCGTSYEEARQELEEVPQLSETTAVQENNYARLGLTNLVTGVRNAEAARDLAEQLYPEEFEGQ